MTLYKGSTKIRDVGEYGVYASMAYRRVNSPVLNGNVISGFTDTNYITVDQALAGLNTADNFEMVFKVTTGNDISLQQYVFCGYGTTARDVVIFLYQSRWAMQLSSNGTDYDIYDGLSYETPSPNTTYWLKLKFLGTRYVLSVSTDGATFKGIISVDNSTKVVNCNSHDLGAIAGATDWYWRGSIDLSGCYVNMNGVRVWDVGNSSAVYSIPIRKIYKGSQLVYQYQEYNNNAVLTFQNGEAIYSDELPEGYYKVALGGAGGTGTTWIAASYGMASAGGSGAFVEVEFYNPKKQNITLYAPPYKSGRGSQTGGAGYMNLGGVRMITANGGNGGGAGYGGSGGSYKINSALGATVIKASNGYGGGTGFSGSVSITGSVSNYNEWGKGGEYDSEYGGFRLEFLRVS